MGRRERRAKAGDPAFHIRERRDASSALFDGSGRMVAQAAHIPVHLGAMPLSVRAAIDSVPMQRGGRPEEVAARRGLPIEDVAPAALLRARAAGAKA